MSKPICIIPARMGSKRLPRKNVIMCDGKPLLWYTIQAAKDSGVFGDNIVVSTDDPIAMSVSIEMGVFHDERDKELCGDIATVANVCFSILDCGDYDTFCVLLPTCPLRSVNDIRECNDLLDFRDCDFVMSVTEYSTHPYQALVATNLLMPLHPDRIEDQSQEWEKLYHHNGAVIFGHVESLRKHKSFYGGKVVPYFMPRERSVDIDTLDDLLYAEYLLKKRRGAV